MIELSLVLVSECHLPRYYRDWEEHSSKSLSVFVGWFQAILPKSALQVEEEAWNAYPYTKTIYRCPFIQKFMLEIETRYYNDGGDQENVFNLSAAEQRNRVVGRYRIL